MFAFVVRDVHDKLETLKKCLDSSDGEHYESILSMIKYETNHPHWGQKSTPMGCRTMLRLNRALAFISLFLNNVNRADSDTSMAHIAQQSYNQTLHKYHKWYVRKAVAVAVYTLPARQQFLQYLDTDPEVLKHSIEDLVTDVNKVHAVIAMHFSEHDLLDLP